MIVLPGTDALAGYQLHHELELYARAGIAPGKYADMLLIDGKPTRDMQDIRRIKSGRIYDPAAIERALGIEPRR
ncbi:hypothetical protein [Steroidobacter agaridevorans]|uniref:hypothetical protein n=1 Tax=Steroidobacter agaridevorans TaxID=2695856 RepID=UPI001328DB45|nr:hypothetical protein [Steroidobacter agaridevorans]GFE88598.1 hypothetical protein GCM10011488_35520 [Steroidobacter agaridevorans]